MLSILAVVSGSACVKRTRYHSAIIGVNDQRTAAPYSSSSSQPRININTASANELETLPGIGKGLAERIIEHREKYGAFRRAEHLIIVRGISDKKFRALQGLITVE